MQQTPVHYACQIKDSVLTDHSVADKVDNGFAFYTYLTIYAKFKP